MVKLGKVSVGMRSKGDEGRVFLYIVRLLSSLINFKKKLRKADKIMLFAFCFVGFSFAICTMSPYKSSHIALESQSLCMLIRVKLETFFIWFYQRFQ